MSKSFHREIKQLLPDDCFFVYDRVKENHLKMLQKNELRVKKYFNHKDIMYTA